MLDADTQCQQSFKGLVKLCSDFGDKPMVCQLTGDPRTKMYSIVSLRSRFIGNHFFYFTTPRHPLCKVLLEQAPLTARRKLLEPFALYILRAIGPGFLMDCASIYKERIRKKQKGIEIRTASLLTIVDSDVMDEFWTHQSASTWLEDTAAHKVLQCFRSKASKE